MASWRQVQLLLRLVAGAAACSGPGMVEDTDAASVATGGVYNRLASCDCQCYVPCGYGACGRLLLWLAARDDYGRGGDYIEYIV